jgi:D-alanyl-D-alanine dipeptidase
MHNKITVIALLLFCTLHPVLAQNFPSESELKKNGFVDVQTLDPSIRVKLMYATTDNFMKRNAYGDFRKCYLRAEVAAKLVNAETLLKKKYPGYTLLVYDAFRPRRIQIEMWKIVKGTPFQQYVAEPYSGSIHNYGAAVDLTVANEDGQPLDMGTPFDYFGAKAQPRYESCFLDPSKISTLPANSSDRKLIEKDIKKSGPLTLQQFNNRRILRSVMEQSGFESISNEWWHFNGFSNQEVKKKYTIVE